MAFQLTIGVDHSGRNVRVTRPHHVLMSGPTGAGKTSAVHGMVLSAIEADVPVIFVGADGSGASDLMTILVAGADRLRLAPNDVGHVRPFGSRWGTRGNPLAPVPGLPPGAQSFSVASAFASMVEGVGIRMMSSVSALAQAAAEVTASTGVVFNLLDLSRWMTDEGARRWLAERVSAPELRQYLREWPERQSTTDAVTSRIRWLCAVPELKGFLASSGCLSGDDLMSCKVCVVNLGDSPPGYAEAASFLGSLVVSRLLAAIQARRHHSEPLLVICDEWHRLVRGFSDEFSSALATHRSRGVYWMLIHQSTLGQVSSVSSSLAVNITTNAQYQIVFRPELADARAAAPYLERGGRFIDPERPDALLSTAASRDHLARRLQSLPDRTFLFIDKRGASRILRARSIGYDIARRRVGAMPLERVDAFMRGRFGVAHTELVAEADQWVDRAAMSGSGEPVNARAPRAAGRPRLRLPE